MVDFKIIAKNDENITYAYENDYEKFYIWFDLILKQVNFSYCRFIKTSETAWTPQMSYHDKHNASMGHWEYDHTMVLGEEEIQFIYNESRKLFGF